MRNTYVILLLCCLLVWTLAGCSARPAASPSAGAVSSDGADSLPPEGPSQAEPDTDAEDSAAPQTPEKPAQIAPDAETEDTPAPDAHAVFTDDADAPQTQGAQAIAMTIHQTPVTVLWEDNASVAALRELLQDGPITIYTERYGGFEQVGGLPQRITSSDVQMTTQSGDIVLYSSDSIVLFYGANTWAYTMLGHIDGLSAAEIEALLDVEQAVVTLCISE